jgi:hypothetical protein
LPLLPAGEKHRNKVANCLAAVYRGLFNLAPDAGVDEQAGFNFQGFFASFR